MFVDSVIREDRSALDLLRADYTFLNERLARHYGIPNVKGTRFRRVVLPADSHRGGLLGQGSILTVTSYPDRTSPVVRGKWILENLLGTPPPPPIPGVPPLKPPSFAGKVLTMRERIAAHRNSPVCASCHSMMDPLGLALEHFDGVGKWRALDESGAPIDASGALARRHEVRRRRRSSHGAADLGSLRHDAHREDADLCARPRRGALRHAGRPRHRPRRGARRLSLHVAHPSHRRKRPVPDEEIALMMITRKALPRRTFVRGLGVALGLPMLDAMVPAMSALAQTPASGTRRLGFVYMPNGVAKNSSIDYWTPTNEGKKFATSQILAPLEPFRDRMLVISGLDQNQAEAGDDGASGDHTRGTSSWLTGVYPKRTEGADVRNGDLRGPDRRVGAREGHGAAVARAGDRSQFPRRPVREQLQLRVSEHARVDVADDAAADREQPAHRLRAPVRRWRHARGASAACAQEAKPARLGPRGPESAAAPSRARRSRRRHRLRGRRARSRAADRKRGDAEPIRSCRSWIDRRGSRSGSTSTSS